LGAHIFKQLLQDGYGVSAGFGPNTSDETTEFVAKIQADYGARLRYRKIDMTKIEDCEALVNGCDAIIHCASRDRQSRAEHPINVLFPEIEEVLNLLTSAQKTGVRRFILLGSVSNVAAGKFRKTFNESHWAHPDDCDDHERAKLFTERTAWHFTEEQANPPFLTVFCPGMMLGPLVRKESNSSSVVFLKKLIGDNFQQYLDLKVPTVDVRDVAELVITAIDRPETFGQRYLLVEGVHSLRDLARVINKETEGGWTKKTGYFSKILMRFIGWFDRDLKKVWEFYGKNYKFDCEKVRRELSAKFRSLDQSLGAMVVSLEKHNVVKYSHDRIMLTEEKVPSSE